MKSLFEINSSERYQNYQNQSKFMLIWQKNTYEIEAICCTYCVLRHVNK